MTKSLARLAELDEADEKKLSARHISADASKYSFEHKWVQDVYSHTDKFEKF